MDVKRAIPDMETARELVADGRMWPLVRDFLWGEDVPCEGESLFYDFSNPGPARIMLLDAEVLGRAAKWIGAILYAPQLRRVMDGASVRSLKASLAGVYPEVFSYVAYFRDAPVPRDAGSFAGMAPEEKAAAVVSAGRAVLAGAAKDAPRPVAELFAKKLGGETEPLECDGRFVSMAFKLKFPEAYRLCFS